MSNELFINLKSREVTELRTKLQIAARVKPPAFSAA